MTALSRGKAEPDNPVRGFLNDVADSCGMPRLEDFFGTPADWAEDIGLPLVRDAIPTPADSAHSIFVKGGGAGFPKPPMPNIPRPESFLPPPPQGMFRQGDYYQKRNGNGYYQQERNERARRRP